MGKWSEQERRSVYRVAPGHADPVAVTILRPLHREPGTLVDLSSQGVAAHFDLEEPPTVVRGDESRVQLSFAHPDRELDVDVLTRYCRETREGWRCGFSFVDPRQFFHRVDPSLWRLFNRRHAFRVRP